MNSTLASCLFIVGLLTTQPVDNRDESKNNTNPVESWTDRIDNVFECPLKKIGYRGQYTLQIHG